jgi:hypothetical protein
MMLMKQKKKKIKVVARWDCKEKCLPKKIDDQTSWGKVSLVVSFFQKWYILQATCQKVVYFHGQPALSEF